MSPCNGQAADSDKVTFQQRQSTTQLLPHYVGIFGTVLGTREQVLQSLGNLRRAGENVFTARFSRRFFFARNGFSNPKGSM